jgi:membrane protease YdiL (CAAX protease family)
VVGNVGGVPDNSTDLADAPDVAVTRSSSRSSHSSSRSSSRGSRDWRKARHPRGWRELLIALALVSLGLSLLGATFVAESSPVLAQLVLWAGLAVPVIAALSLARPRGLLRIRPIDLLYAVVLGGLLRLIQGWVDAAATGVSVWPSYTLIDGSLPSGWLLVDGLGVAVISPVLEEFFFRGVLLVSLFVVLRRPFGRLVAGWTAGLVSTAVFVAVHALTLQISAADVIALALLGGVASALVVLTGRIWGAVLVHVVFNASFVMLALVGTWFVAA